ncbi:MAG: helix-turn-helix domain-containing protein [Gammaproteobacteria bacterium]|nr:helix-turn-helix domain-containing protein [Gammaproteobacteria bacterium]
MPRIADEILRGRQTPTWIAHEYGFTNAAHLSHVFREAAGMSPAAFRQIVLGSKSTGAN